LLTAFIAAIALTMSPAVQSIQDPRGLHTETLTGSIFGLARSLTGSDLGIVNTATAYIDAPAWAQLLNVLVGGLLSIWLLGAVRTRFTWHRAWLLTGALVGAGLIAAPYFSTQYVCWLTPFVAADRRLNGAALGVGIASLILAIAWFQLFEGAVWWWALLVMRNLLLIGIVVLTGRIVIQARTICAEDVERL
jgi:hypothetical protein